MKKDRYRSSDLYTPTPEKLHPSFNFILDFAETNYSLEVCLS